MFFDLEGDTFAADGGIEYLFGVADRDGNYNASWALDPGSEKRAVERFIDKRHGALGTVSRLPHLPLRCLRDHRRQAPDEPLRDPRGRRSTGCCAAASSSTSTAWFGRGLRASVESYSIKRLEPFYSFARAVDLTTATRALIQVEVRLESGDAAGVPEPLRTEIEGYNRDDCLSTLRLAAWLEECRRDLQALTGQPVPRPKRRDEERDREQEPAVETAALFEALTAGLPVDDAELDDEQRARRLLAHLLEFHRREDKSMWWEYFHRCGFTEEEHVESRATLGALTYGGEAGQVKRSVIHRYRFPEQPHEIEVGDSPKNPDTAESDEFKRGFCGTVVALDETTGTVDLKRGRSSSVPHPAALVPLDNIQNTVCCGRVSPGSRKRSCPVASRRIACDGRRSTCSDSSRRASELRRLHRTRQASPPGKTSWPRGKLRSPPSGGSPRGSTGRCSPCRGRRAAARPTQEPG